MRLVHIELVEKDFMKRLVDYNIEIQNFINNSSFQNYNTWRIVLKEDSISTPVRHPFERIVAFKSPGLTLTRMRIKR